MPYSLLFQLFCYMLAQPHYPSLALVSYLKPLCFFYASPTPSAWGHPSQQCPFSHRGFPGIYPELTSYLRGPPGKPCWPLHTAGSLLPDLPAPWVPSPRTFTLYWNFTLHERPSSPMGSQHFLLLSSISKGHISSIFFWAPLSVLCAFTNWGHSSCAPKSQTSEPGLRPHTKASFDTTSFSSSQHFSGGLSLVHQKMPPQAASTSTLQYTVYMYH